MDGQNYEREVLAKPMETINQWFGKAMVIGKMRHHEHNSHSGTILG